MLTATSVSAPVPDAAEVYALGNNTEESVRLQRQSDELRPESVALLSRIGLQPGQSAIDLGCGPSGILDLLSPAELEGVMAHEITHVVNRDVMVMTLASFFAMVASLIVQFGFFFGGGLGGGYGRNQEAQEAMFAAIAAAAVVYAISFMLLRALSRYREFAADRGSAVLTGRPSALASALLKISGTMERVPSRDLRTVEGMSAFFIVPARAKNSLMNLFADHPPLEQRLAALERLESQLQGTA